MPLRGVTTEKFEFDPGSEAFHGFIDNLNDSVVAMDISGRIHYANLSARRLLGYMTHELEQMLFFDLLHPRSASYLREIYAKIKRGSPVTDQNFIFISKSGEEIPLSGSMIPVLSAQGGLTVWGIFRSAERHPAEIEDVEALKRRRFELEALKSLSDRLTNIFDIREAVKTINSYLTEVLEYSTATYLILNPDDKHDFIYLDYLKEPVGNKFIKETRDNIVKYFRAEKVGGLDSALKQFISSQPETSGYKIAQGSALKPRSQLFFPLRLAGDTFGVIHIASAKPGMYESGTNWLTDAMVVTFVLFIVRLQTLVRSQRSRTESLVKSLSDGIIMFNTKMNVVLMNPPGSIYTGLPASRASLGDFYTLFPDINMQAKTTEMLISAKTVHVEDALLKDRHYEIFFTPVKDNQGKVVSGAIILHDITQLKEIDEMKSDFVFMASHQLRTPLTGIKWFTKLLEKALLREGTMSPRDKECLEQINISNDMMIKLVNDLLNVSRIESGRKFKIEKTAVKFDEIIEQIKKNNIVVTTTNKIKLIVSSQPKRLVFYADGPKFQQVLHNLVNNAVKYSPPKSTVKVEAEQGANETFFSVTDNGIGIPKNQQKKIFEKFFRADNAASHGMPGSGLGLYLAKAVIEAHGGKLSFKSAENKGTTFTLTLPNK